MKKALIVFSSVEVGALRVAIVFFTLTPFVITHFRRIPKKKWSPLIISGFVGYGAPAFLFAYAQTGIDSNLAGLLNALTPLFTLLSGTMFFKVKGTLSKGIGVFIGLVGAMGLIAVSGGHSFEFNFKFSIYVIIATILYALNVNIIKTYLNDLKAIDITGLAYIFTGLPCVIYLFFTDFYTDITTHENGFQSFMYIVILAVIGTAISLVIFNFLIKMTNALFASSVTYMIPIVAIIWGVVDGELFKPSYLIWISMILIGVYLVNKKKKRVNEKNKQ